MLQNKFEYLVGFFCCVTDSTGKEYTRHYIDKPADSAQRDARSAYNKVFTSDRLSCTVELTVVNPVARVAT